MAGKVNCLDFPKGRVGHPGPNLRYLWLDILVAEKQIESKRVDVPMSVLPQMSGDYRGSRLRIRLAKEPGIPFSFSPVAIIVSSTVSSRESSMDMPKKMEAFLRADLLMSSPAAFTPPRVS